jgi:hypothetical protein
MHQQHYTITYFLVPPSPLPPYELMTS